MDQKKGTSLTTTLAVWRRDIRAAGESTILEHLQRLCKQTFHYLIFTKKSRKYPSNGFVIRFTIWLTLQKEVEALHICKPFHHFAPTISAFHVGLRPPGPPHPARFLYARPPSLPRAPALPTAHTCPPAAARARRPSRRRTELAAARPRRLARVHEPRRMRPRLDDVRGHDAGTEVDLPSEEDGGGRSRTDVNDDGDERGLGWAATGVKTWAGRQLAATWPGRRLARTTYVKMARRKKNARARSVKKNSEVGSTLWVC